MSERKTIVGTLAGIMDKGSGFHEIHITVPGREYPVKASTKKLELVEQARTAGQDPMEWTVSEHDSGKPNPHRPGENFINRYFEGVNPLGTTTAGAAAAPSSDHKSESALTKEQWRAKDRAADKRACIAIAASALAPIASSLIPANPSDDEIAAYGAKVIRLAQMFADAVEWTRNTQEVPFS